MISGKKILVTGVTGMVGSPIAHYLAKDNEVWGAARFTDPETRKPLEAAGIKTVAVDVGSGDFSNVPDDFTYVIHANWMRAGIAQLQEAIRNNIEGPGLLMQHTRKAKATLVVSGMPIYSPHADPKHLFTESDPIGNAGYAYAPTSPYSKAGVEAVARFCARAFNMPTVIMRLNTVMGATRGMFPQVIKAVLSGSPLQAPYDPNMHSPIHTDDMVWQVESLLGAAAVPALCVNWGSDEATAMQDWVAKINEWSGKDATVEVRTLAGAPISNPADPTLRKSITGPCRMDFWTELRKTYDAIVASGDTAANLSGIAIPNRK